MTALHIASFWGHTEIVETLLNQKDIQVNITSNDGGTALHEPSSKGYTEIVKLLKANGGTMR